MEALKHFNNQKIYTFGQLAEYLMVDLSELLDGYESEADEAGIVEETRLFRCQWLADTYDCLPLYK